MCVGLSILDRFFLGRLFINLWSVIAGAVLFVVFLITLHLSKASRESKCLYYFVIGGYTFGIALILNYLAWLIAANTDSWGNRTKLPFLVEYNYYPLIFIGIFGASALGLLLAVRSFKPTDDPKKPLYFGLLFAFLI